MKPLETTFRKDGFDYTQLARNGAWCVYVKTKVGFRNTFYEVMRIKSHNGRKIGETDIPPAEYLPSNEEWGANGFSFSDKERAMKHFEKMQAVK